MIFANHMKLLCDFGWISVRNLINFDLAVVFMYNTQRGLAPDNIKDSFKQWMLSSPTRQEQQQMVNYILYIQT